MNTLTGFLLIILVGILQGAFMFPSKFIHGWKWENYWLVYSIFGLLIINFILGILLIPDAFAVILKYQRISLVLFLLGLLWGAGSIMFGKGMELLGMSLGYPIIMGIASSFGAIFPALIFSPGIFLTFRGVLLIIGVVIAVAGIIICSKATGLKEERTDRKKAGPGLLIAVGAGILCTMPNIAIVLGNEMINAAGRTMSNPSMAPNLIWLILFPAGFLINIFYISFLFKKNKSGGFLFKKHSLLNWALSAIMGVMWILSLYLYGAGTNKMGRMGIVIGWPVYVSLSIIVGNLLGIASGEWKYAPSKARNILNIGMAVLIISIIIISLSN
jgi:L-rhamnose-H+ transport protein